MTVNTDFYIFPRCKFIDQFEMSEEPQKKLKRRKKKKGKPAIPRIDPIEAHSFQTLLNGTGGDSFQIEDRQEDAEEFLGVLLNRLNDEMKRVSMIGNQKYYLDLRYFLMVFLIENKIDIRFFRVCLVISI